MLAVTASLGTLFAWDYEHVQIGDLYYNLDATNKMAEVTSQYSSYPYWSATITTADIPMSVFYNSVTYSVTSIGKDAFYNCNGLTSVTIPNSVTSIGSDAFRGCSGLTSVTIPNSVTSIGNYAFYNCSGLKEVHISDLATWCKIGFGSYFANPLYYAHNLYLNGSLITDLVIPNSVTSIGNYAFYDCSGLTSVTIPNSVTSIGSSAFYNCSGLTSVTIPNSVTSIGSYAFYNVLNIAYNGTATGSLWGARSVNGYVDGHFVYSDATKTELIKCSAAIEGGADIPSGVKKISESAFSNCSGLTSVTIPNSVTSIGYNAFSDCNGLKEVHISDMAAWCKIRFATYYGYSHYTNPLSQAHKLYLNAQLVTDLVIPNSVTTIGSYAFYDCSGLTSVTIPNSVTSIGYDAFRGCSMVQDKF